MIPLVRGTITRMSGADSQPILATRLGKTVHTSVLRFRLDKLRREFPCSGCACIEDWLIRLANVRGATVVIPRTASPATFTGPDVDQLGNEDLVVAICQLNCLDRPQMLRLAAQLVSRSMVDTDHLILSARRERCEPVLAELGRQALKVAPDHPAWRAICEAFSDEPKLREPLLHWTRLAEPIMKDGRCNAESWRLVA